jgi:hypothetical protein
MEAIVRPQGWDHWDNMNMRPLLQALRSEAGEVMVLQDNFFIEKILPGAILRTLSAEEMAHYRRPFAEPGEGRRPTLTWPREIPIEGEAADVAAIVAAYAAWLATSDVPKLFLKAEPGSDHSLSYSCRGVISEINIFASIDLQFLRTPTVLRSRLEVILVPRSGLAFQREGDEDGYHREHDKCSQKEDVCHFFESDAPGGCQRAQGQIGKDE